MMKASDDAALSSDFRRIAVWQLAQDLAEKVAEVIAKLPHDRVANAIANQLMRAAGSVPANIAEGYGRFSQAAYRSHLSVARGSLFEAESWIDLLARRKYLSPEAEAQLIECCSEVGKMLTVRMKSLGDAPKSYARKAGLANG